MSDNELSFQRYSGLILRHNIDLVRREIAITGSISWKTLTKLDKQLKLLEIQTDPIIIIVNTPGGDLEATLGIIDRIHNSSSEITTIGTGIIMSAGIPIIASGTYRKATKFARFMHHDCSMGLTFSRLASAESELKYCKELNNTINKYLASKTTKPYSFWVTTGKHVDHYFTSEEALSYGLIDEIL